METPQEGHWNVPTEFPILSRNDVHVWQVNLPDFQKNREELSTLLNETEKERAARYKFDDIRNNYIICRGALKLILSHYLGEPKGGIELLTNSGGKPVLSETPHHKNLQFNLSHSGKICLVAVSRALELGIDIEELKPIKDLESMARKILSESEMEDFFSRTSEKQLTLFYDIWSAKETLLKTAGFGLAIDPRQFEVKEVQQKRKFSIMTPAFVFDVAEIELLKLNGLRGYTGWLAATGSIDALNKFKFMPGFVS